MFEVIPVGILQGQQCFVSLSELTRKRKHQYPHSNAKLGSFFDDDSNDSRLDNVKINLYLGEYQSGQDEYQGRKNDDETPEQQSSSLTGTTLGQSTTPRADFLMEGDGSIVISWYGKTNLLDDRDAFVTEFGTAIPYIYSTETLKEGMVLSTRSAIEYFSACCMFDVFSDGPSPGLRWYF